jgi:hypothetical protein
MISLRTTLRCPSLALAAATTTLAASANLALSRDLFTNRQGEEPRRPCSCLTRIFWIWIGVASRDKEGFQSNVNQRAGNFMCA